MKHILTVSLCVSYTDENNILECIGCRYYCIVTKVTLGQPESLVRICGNWYRQVGLSNLFLLFDGDRSLQLLYVESCVLCRPKPSVKIPLSVLSGAHQCELSAGLHQLIHGKFMSIVGQFFKPVASNQDYFFYSFNGLVARRYTCVCRFVLCLFWSHFSIANGTDETTYASNACELSAVLNWTKQSLNIRVFGCQKAFCTTGNCVRFFCVYRAVISPWKMMQVFWTHRQNRVRFVY